MREEDLPEAAREALKIQRFNQEQYAKHLDQVQEGHMADMTRFVQFIGSLDNHQLDELVRVIAHADQSRVAAAEYAGLIMGLRVFDRGLTADGKTWEEALGLDKLEPVLGVGSSHSPDRESSRSEKDLQEALEHEAKLMEYDLVEEASGAALHTPCGNRYASVDDAVETFIRKDGCPACQHKEKWG